MRKHEEKCILKILRIILNIVWWIIKYIVLWIYFSTKWIWGKWTELMGQKKRILWIVARTLSLIPIYIMLCIWIFIYIHQEELKEWWIKAAWCIMTKGKCVIREIRQDLRHDMLQDLSWSLLNNTWLTQ